VIITVLADKLIKLICYKFKLHVHPVTKCYIPAVSEFYYNKPNQQINNLNSKYNGLYVKMVKNQASDLTILGYGTRPNE